MFCARCFSALFANNHIVFIFVTTYDSNGAEKDCFMDNKQTITKYFVNNFPAKIQNLFHQDPKKFKTLYQSKLANIVKQDLLQMVQFVTPVYEIVHYSDWCDSWHKDFYWYKIKPDNINDAKILFGIYCRKELSDTEENKTKIIVNNKEFFNLLRTVYYYVNYNNRKMWKMPGILTLNPSEHDTRSEIYTGDFIKTHYNPERKKSSLQIEKKKSELGNQIIQGCQKIADKLIDAEITRICNINIQIQQAKETLAKYGTELIRGY